MGLGFGLEARGRVSVVEGTARLALGLFHGAERLDGLAGEDALGAALGLRPRERLLGVGVGRGLGRGLGIGLGLGIGIGVGVGVGVGEGVGIGSGLGLGRRWG